MNDLNPLGHILFANLLLTYYLDKVSFTEMCMVSISGIIVDLDHIPSLGDFMRTKRFGPGVRSRWHEIYGLLASLILSFLIMFISIDVGRILMIGFTSHYFLDMITRPTRPYYPLSEKTVFLKLAPTNHSNLIIYDIVVTAFFGLMLWLNQSVLA